MHGDQITIGALVFSVIIEAQSQFNSRAVFEDLVVSWLAEDLDDSDTTSAENAATVEMDTGVLFDAGEEELEAFRLKYAVVQDVLVVIPLSERLDDTTAVDLLRQGLYLSSSVPCRTGWSWT